MPEMRHNPRSFELKVPFFLAKTGVSRKTLSFLARFLLSFYIGVRRILRLIFAVFLYKNQDKSLLYPGLDYSYLFDVVGNVKSNVCFDNFIIVLS